MYKKTIPVHTAVYPLPTKTESKVIVQQRQRTTYISQAICL
jgi:hypothetical protein